LVGTPARADRTAVELRNPDARALLGSCEEATRADFEDFFSLWQQHGTGPNPLLTLHSLLEPHHLHFGYRVVNEASRFVRLGWEHVEAPNLDRLFDLQMLQNIIPKFHGTAARLKEPLTRLFWFCRGLADPGSGDFDEALALSDPDMGEFRLPASARKLQRMLRTLREERYVSAIQ